MTDQRISEITARCEAAEKALRTPMAISPFDLSKPYAVIVEDIPWLLSQLSASKRKAQDARNELCQKCGRYREAHNGSCDGCRWKETEAMSEIEKAIMYWEEFKQEAIDMIAEGKYSNSVLEKQIPMCNTALAALREQAERSRGCVWCRSDSQVTHNGEHFCFFCSYCGKRLEVEP